MDKESTLEKDEQVIALEEMESALPFTWDALLDNSLEVPRVFMRATSRFSDLTEGDKFTEDKLYELTKLTFKLFISNNQTFRDHLDKLDESVEVLNGNIWINKLYKMYKSFSVADGICDCCGRKIVLSNDTVCYKCRERMNDDLYVRSVLVANMDDVVMKYLDRSQRVNLNAFY